MANEFFGAVTKNCKRIVVERNKRAVREKISQLGITRNNVAIFKCRLSKRKIKKKLIHKPRFRLMARHHVILENACLTFSEDRKLDKNLKI